MGTERSDVRGPRHAAEAREVVREVLGTLADPDAVAADTGVPAGPAGPAGENLWTPSSHAAVSLAFSGATAREPEYVAGAHAYLLRALAAVAGGGPAPRGVFSGTSGAAYALLVAHRATGGYRSALERLDAYHRDLVRKTLPPVTDEPVATNHEFETIYGMSGVGRFLLARGEAARTEAHAVLGYLTGLAHGTAVVRGHRVPRWWSRSAPRKGQEAELPDGHLNLGLAHGVAGPLALLALAWRAGETIEGQREAIENLVGLLERWAVPDDGEAGRPPFLTLDDWSAGPAALRLPWQRPSWCYGAPGVSRAIQLAALALDRPDWHELAHRSLLPLLSRPVADWGLEDAGICHGAGGLLHLLGLLGAHMDDARLPAVRDDLAALALGAFDERYRFGFRAAMTNVPGGADLPGFLDGAAGVALALDAYANGRAHADWDMALLVN
ncbi:lanthionine synthetase C family protein [Streptomyces sp. URMC 126]|uniref:lanthionine synthetase C family protein n=1 Tax=Streptomyces sp. URMC 126 TaxID=3423401 RepID=UPI003F1B0AD5